MGTRTDLCSSVEYDFIRIRAGRSWRSMLASEQASAGGGSGLTVSGETEFARTIIFAFLDR